MNTWLKVYILGSLAWITYLYFWSRNQFLIPLIIFGAIVIPFLIYTFKKAEDENSYNFLSKFYFSVGTMFFVLVIIFLIYISRVVFLPILYLAPFIILGFLYRTYTKHKYALSFSTYLLIFFSVITTISATIVIVLTGIEVQRGWGRVYSYVNSGCDIIFRYSNNYLLNYRLDKI